MNKQNSSKTFFDPSVNCLLNMRRLTQFYPESISYDDLKSTNFEMNNNHEINDFEYIPPSPTISIETNNKNNHHNQNLPNNNRFAFLISDTKQNDICNNNSNNIFKMKYELPNIKILQSPIKTFKPIQIVSFMKK